MVKKSGSVDDWRDYFRTANSDIFDIINRAITVAATDCPKEFRSRRDRIAELLFSSKLNRCTGCDRVELFVPDEEYEDENDRGCKNSASERGGAATHDNDDDDDEEDGGDYGFETAGGSKESKVNSSRGDDHVTINANQVTGSFSYGEAEALTDEIEEESKIVEEVVRIKEILLNSQDESDSLLFDSLRRLQLMALTVNTLQETEIGKAVNRLRRHGSQQIRNIVRTLITEWKDLVDEWVKVSKGVAAAEGTPDSVNPSVVDEEEGLPSPPMDDGVFFATQPTGMELSQFFDGMDDDGNPRNGGAFIKNRENVRKTSQPGRNIANRRQQSPTEANDDDNNDNNNRHRQQLKRQEAPVKPNKLGHPDSAPRRPPPKQTSEPKQNNNNNNNNDETKSPLKQKMLLNGQQDKFKCSEDAVRQKLEASKRKLQERYQQVENAKRRRTIQVMELHDLPKQGLGHKNAYVKPGNHNNRHLPNGRR